MTLSEEILELRRAIQEIADLAAPLPPEAFNVTALHHSRCEIFDVAAKALSLRKPLVSCWNCPQALLPSWRYCHMCGAKQKIRGGTPQDMSKLDARAKGEKNV